MHPEEYLAQYWVHSRCSKDINNSDACFKEIGLLSIRYGLYPSLPLTGLLMHFRTLTLR